MGHLCLFLFILFLFKHKFYRKKLLASEGFELENGGQLNTTSARIKTLISSAKEKRPESQAIE